MARQRRGTRLDQSVIEPFSCASLAYSENERRAVKYKSRSIGFYSTGPRIEARSDNRT